MTTELSLWSDALATRVAAASPSIVRVDGGAPGGSSGVVFAPGVVVTTLQAVERDDALMVYTHDGRALPARLLGRDSGTDLAVLGLAPDTALEPLRFAESDAVRVGQLVLSVARPGRTVRATSGIVSAFGEGYRTPMQGRVDRYLESDAPLRPGFAGGALLSADGAALGIVTGAIVRGTTVAIPTSTVRRVVAEVASHGRVRRGYLGVGSYPIRLSAALAARFGQGEGAVVVAVEPDGPADRAGILQGDVLLGVDDARVSHPSQVAAAIEDRADSAVRVRALRGGDLRELVVTVGHRR
jgi:S1-C subfamily serine protease